MVWAASLKLYYIGHIARGVLGINDRAFDHIYETHQFFATNSITPPNTYTSLNLPCSETDKSKKVLVLDLDETLIHYHTDDDGTGAIEIEIDEG